MASSVAIGAVVTGTVDRSFCQNGMRLLLGWGARAGLLQQHANTMTNTPNAIHPPKYKASIAPAERPPCDVLDVFDDGAKA